MDYNFNKFKCFLSIYILYIYNIFTYNLFYLNIWRNIVYGLKVYPSRLLIFTYIKQKTKMEWVDK